MGIALLPQALTPELCDVQRTVPIAQFERRVHGGCRRQSLLCGDASAQGVAVVGLVVCGEVAHELSGLVHEARIFPQYGGRRVGPVEQFGEIYQMWLLPDEEAANLGRGFASPRIGHLHPSHSLEALSLRYAAGIWLGLEIP